MIDFSGWRKRQIALDQKAENARELGLDYEQKSVAWEQFHEHMAGANYVAPQRTWVGLTDEEIQECLKGLPTQTVDIYARRIEAKLKEKNT